MMDYIRHQNLADGNLAEGSRYSVLYADAYGQVAPICLCGGANDHSSISLIASSPVPKGAGASSL